ncbi:MAG TPA: MazG nucleotide pyrophosphohydrolase domain-containing protein [Patescibacteria group bacterium]|nr:MazG nucleotide pyrophosphohydrolase domain-containing protein [Patescibacteria group bacterium]
MTIQMLQKRMKEEMSKTKIDYTIDSKEDQEILARTVKLNEEVGELCNDILSVLKLQRKSKLDRFDKRNFYEEFADVIITAMQLATVAGVDINRAIRDKMKKISERYEKE